MRNFCILSGIIIGIVFPILLLDYFIKNGFLQNFMETEALSIMGNMLAIYVGVVTAFMVILDNIQEKIKNNCSNTQKKLKNNIVLMLIIYGLQILLLISTPEKYNNSLFCEYFIKGFEVLLFSLYFLMFYEIIDVFFVAKSFLQPNRSNPK